jgi:hypothetical protein
MWEPVLWLALIVAAWRWMTRRPSTNVLGPLANVGDAPSDAEPVIRPRLDDNGLATYSVVVPGRKHRVRPRSRARRETQR